MQCAPEYVEFRVGDYQHGLGIIDRRFAGDHRPDGVGGGVVYWHVDNVQAIFDRLLAMGLPSASRRSRGPGFVTASVVDPFGNILGVIYNQHYLDVLGGAR